MSSDLYVFDSSFYRQHSSPEMAPSDAGETLTFSLNLSLLFVILPLDILQAISNSNNTSMINPNHPPLANGYQDFSSLDAMEVKSEESLRSYSSNSFDNKSGFLFRPQVDTLMEPPNANNQALSSPERTAHKPQRSFSSHVATESPFTEEANFKVGRYSAEERKEKILKYRAKRNQRNFNKTIKYACRKTLADNRPRIRGRFARNDETGEIPKAACSTRYEDEDELCLGGLHEEDDHGTMRGPAFVSSYGQHQFQYYGCFEIDSDPFFQLG
ncbi:hypothetical protein Patl1_17686 [Pistacia atlantica]|uniref:Uncharacterized protein n=1 Tax=Pistacia atlantica TaxID=434234 RepID=A0ACC1BZV9_9ROSI|nr:hypothetical protein Patl1_17686 [Pistacia atlantica]